MTKIENKYIPKLTDYSNKKLVPISLIKKVIIIVDKPERIRHNQLIKSFPNSEFTFLTNRTEKVDNSTGNNFTIHRKDFSFTKLKNERIKLLLETDFDLLIDLNLNKGNLKKIAKQVKSTLKCGCFDTPKNGYLDLLVKQNNDLAEVILSIQKQIDLLTKI